MSKLRWYWNRVKTYIGRPRLVVQDRPVLLADHPRCEHPLFVVGPHRSGTSLLRRMLNSHPDISCPPESFFIADYARMARDDEVLAGYLGLGFNAEQARADLERKASELHEALRIARGKKLWADKTPQYVFHLDAIDHLFAQRNRYLMIRRHPWDSAFSIAARGWRFNDTPDLLDAALVHVRNSLEAMARFEAAYPERCASVEYGALCTNPEAELAPALAALGLKWHPDMLEFGQKKHNFGLEDPVLRGQRDIVPSHGAWRSWNRDVQDRARTLLDPAEFGYSTDAEATARQKGDQA